MSDTKFTPGPWGLPHMADSSVSCNCRYVLAEYGGMGSIATIDCCRKIEHPWGDDVGPNHDQAVANAHLIVTAPKLYDLVELVYESFGGGNVVTFSDKDVEEFRLTLEQARGES